MDHYRVRPATLDDTDVLVRHRIGMFTDMGVAVITILPWPPGPRDVGGRLAFVYNVYTEPNQRRRGHAQIIMHAIHAWCREAGIGSVALNASRFGQPLYESMGYQVAPSPMMFLGLE